MLPLPLMALLAAAPPPSTLAEQSNFTRTGRYPEVLALCDAYAKHYGGVRCERFGTTPEGRAMVALVVERKKGAPAIVVQGGIHAGEIDGKDAGFLVLRELLDGKAAQAAALERVTLVFVPVFNVDGHERFGANHRPNQRGPKEMGWRTTARNLNLNRDYMKADAPEMRAMLALLNKWDPIAYVDLHVTDGAMFQPDVAVIIDQSAMPEAARKLNGAIIATLNEQGHKALDFYPAFEKDDDPSSGFSHGIAPPRLSTPYWGVRNRFGMLVETHSWKDYKTRVLTTRDVLRALLAETVHVNDWVSAARAADAKPAGDVVLAWENTDEKITLEFPGYAYTRELSPVSGALRTIYDEKKPQIWRIPHLPSVKPALTAKAPAAYLVPRAWADVVTPVLDAHGIEYGPAAGGAVDARVFRATEVTHGTKPYEGRMTTKVKGEWAAAAAKITAQPGDLVVSTQKKGRLIVHLFEPTAPDSFVSWGFFNAVFEQKEYMEPYVTEAVALEMLRDPAVKAEFVSKLNDAAFAGSPEKRLEFFYKRHASWDERKDRYPVLRLE